MRIARQLFHPGLVPEDRPARPRRGRINGQHRNAEPPPRQHQTKTLDKCGLAHTGCPRQTNAQRLLAGAQRCQQLRRLRAMIGTATFHQRDGTGKNADVCRQDASFVVVEGELCPSPFIEPERRRREGVDEERHEAR